MFKLCRFNCFKMEGPHAANYTAWLNPLYVIEVKRKDGITIIETTAGTHYTTVQTESVMHALDDTARLNKLIIQMN